MAPVIRWYHSLAWRFFLRTAAAVVLIMAVVLWVAYDQAGKGARDAGERGLHSASLVLERQLPQEARLLDSGLEIFITQSSNVSYLDEALRSHNAASVKDYLLQSLGNLRGDLAVLVRPDGFRFAATADQDPDDYSSVTIVQMALDPDVAREAGRPGPSYAGYLEIPRGPQHGMYFAVSRPVRLPGGSIIGAMLLGRRLGDEYSQFLRDLAAGQMKPLTHLAILSRSQTMGTSLPATGLAELGKVLETPNFQTAQKEVAQGQISQPFPLHIQGVRYLATLSPLRGEDGATLAMSTLLLAPLDPYFVPFKRIQKAILWTGFAGLFLALFVALRSAHRVTWPLQALTRATATLAQGDRPELPEQDTPDEVGLLSRAFRSLLSELRAKEELLSALARLKPVEPASGSGNPMPLDTGETGPVKPDADATALVAGTAPSASSGVDIQFLLRKGTVFAERYRVESVLGKGGMGIVLKVRDLHLEEDVALKIIRPEQGATPEFLEQLKQEIRLARKISHRNVLRTHDFGEYSGIPFVTMEFLQGVNLKQLQEDRGRLPLPLVLRIGRQVGEGLAAAHAEGVVHRDVKPLNVLFDTRGDVKLLDFGLAAPVAAPGGAQTGFVLGTPRYMAPEQVRGEQVDPRTDLYALGVMLFELVTGHPPFENTDITQLLEMHLTAAIPRIQDQGLPPAFCQLVERLLAKRKEDRPSSAAEVVEIIKLISSDRERTWAA